VARVGSGAKETVLGSAAAGGGNTLKGSVLGCVRCPTGRHVTSDGDSVTLRGGSWRWRSEPDAAGDGLVSGLTIDVKMFDKSVSAL
jgi:hypothetical protein